MWDAFTRELGGRGTASLVAFVLGWISGRLLARWRRMRQRRLILRSDARDTVIIEHHIVEPASGPDPELPGRTRAGAGRSPESGAGPGGARPGHPQRPPRRRVPRPRLEGDPAAHLDLHGGGRGSYLLETLTGFVGDRAAGRQGFDHDLYAMAPCCESPASAPRPPFALDRMPPSWPDDRHPRC